MKQSRDRIPDEVIEGIFPKKLKRYGASGKVYSQLKKMILKGELKKGESLSYERIVQEFNVSRDIAHGVISQLKKDGLVISKRGVGSFVTNPLKETR
ncbi:MAG: winged helix-turn-helix domain-containing protein [Thermodesulfobacteriota bacterium]|jgi:DNA-binding GntR family transcriptional regulator